MAALSTQPCTAWPAGSCRAPPEAAPRRQGPVPPQRPPALPQGWAPKKAAGSRTRTPTTARARSRQRGPSLPARRRGQWGAARQEPANTQTRPWKLAARPRYGEQAQPSWNAAPLSSFPSLPAPSRRPALLTYPAARARTPSHPLAPGYKERAGRSRDAGAPLRANGGPRSPRAARPGPCWGGARCPAGLWGARLLLGLGFCFAYKGVVPNQV